MVPFIELAPNGVARLVLLGNSVFPMGGPGVGAVHQPCERLDELCVARPHGSCRT